MKNIFMVFVLSLLVFSAGTVYSQGTTAGDTTQTDPTDSVATDENWKENFDKKIDTTIKILSVVKEEINEEDDEEIATSSSVKVRDEEDASLKDSVRTIIRKTGRVWKKVKEIVAEDEGPEDEAVDDAREEAANKELSKKIDTTIGIMQVMKEELDKLREDDASASEDGQKDE